MSESTPLERAQKNLEAAEAALASEQGRIQEARDDLAAVDAKIIATDPAEPKALARLDGERTGLRVVLEVLERARLPAARAAVEEAERVVVAAKREKLREEQLATFRQLCANRTRLEQKVAAATEAFFAGPEAQRDAQAAPFLAEIRDLLRELHTVWHAGWDFVGAFPPSCRATAHEERARVWPTTPWPGGHESDAHLLDGLERVVRPDEAEPDPRANERAMREADRRNDERFLARLREDLVREQPPARGPTQESGLNEQQLAGMRRP